MTGERIAHRDEQPSAVRLQAPDVEGAGIRDLDSCRPVRTARCRPCRWRTRMRPARRAGSAARTASPGRTARSTAPRTALDRPAASASRDAAPSDRRARCARARARRPDRPPGAPRRTGRTRGGASRRSRARCGRSRLPSARLRAGQRGGRGRRFRLLHRVELHRHDAVEERAVSKQEGALVEPFSAEPARDLVVGLARVARPARGHDVLDRVPPAARERQDAVVLKRACRRAAVGAAAPRGADLRTTAAAVRSLSAASIRRLRRRDARARRD